MKPILRYFFPYKKPITKFKRTLAREIDNAGASIDEQILMQMGYARNKEEAKILMKTYKATYAYQVIAAMPKPRGSAFFRRLQLIMMKIEGATFHNPLKRSDKSYYAVRYKD